MKSLFAVVLSVALALPSLAGGPVVVVEEPPVVVEENPSSGMMPLHCVPANTPPEETVVTAA